MGAGGVVVTYRDQEKFITANELWRSKKRRMPWAERVEMIRASFPSIDMDLEDWKRDGVLVDEHDPREASEVMVKLVIDILKDDQVDPERKHGARPALDVDRGMQTWNEMTGREYSELPFQQAFTIVVGDNSLTMVARKTNISRSRVHRLLQGAEQPTVEDMRMIAAGYGRKPSYFLEFRSEYIMAALMSRLSAEPELVTTIYAKLMRAL